jgi:glycopeptide antibiotics resistance protein
MGSAGGRSGVDSRQRRGGRPSRWLHAAALVYSAVLAAVTLLPVSWSVGFDDRLPTDNRPQLVPFKGILFELSRAPLETLFELLGNVLLFAPLGFLLPLLLPAVRRWWQALAVGAGVSLAIELYQLTWPGVRKADVNDVLMNALGALLGLAALRVTERFLGRRLSRQCAGRRSPTGSGPSAR